MSRVIRAERDRNGARVHVDNELLAPDSELWHMSLCLRDHAPTGPEWGYHGSGPSQLAIAILLVVTDTVEAERFYPLFSERRPLPHPGRSLDPSRRPGPALARPGTRQGPSALLGLRRARRRRCPRCPDRRPQSGRPAAAHLLIKMIIVMTMGYTIRGTRGGRKGGGPELTERARACDLQ